MSLLLRRSDEQRLARDRRPFGDTLLRMGRLAIVVAAVSAVLSWSVGCLRSTEFHCTGDSECSGGVCESTGYCSFTDMACSSGRRYGDLSGAHSNECVGSTGGMVDASIDGMGSGSGSGSGSGCPSTYATITGGGTHQYRKLTAAQWNAQKSSCAADGSNAYLAIPDDMTELVAITTLSASARTWIGINDQATEGVYQTVKMANATYLPWDTGNGEPNDTPGGQDCVAAKMSSPLIETDKCGDVYVAVCECEP